MGWVSAGDAAVAIAQNGTGRSPLKPQKRLENSESSSDCTWSAAGSWLARHAWPCSGQTEWPGADR